MSFQLHVFSLHVSRSHPQMNNGYLHCLLILNFPSSCKSHRIDWILCDEVIQLFSLGLPRTARMESMISCEACAMMHGTIMSLTARMRHDARHPEFRRKSSKQTSLANATAKCSYGSIESTMESRPNSRKKEKMKNSSLIRRSE